MYNRMKAILNAVSFDTQPSVTTSSSSSQTSNALSPKFPYTRPHFLNLNVQEEVPLSADHRVRPIIVPRERDALPWCSGYAECVNAGKSAKNEDQATVYEFCLPVGGTSFENTNENEANNADLKINVTYFGMFDGHAGFGAAVCASKQLHYIIEEKLLDIAPMIWDGFLRIKPRPPRKDINYELLIIGALEKSFVHMDEIIAEDRDKYLAAGGCTALVSLFILGKVYIANAGDSRVVHCTTLNGVPHGVPMSFDFTPESEKPRIRQLAEQQPELLQGEYTWREYQKQPSMQDLGKQVIYRDATMIGWTTKTLTKEDMKMPVISGEGKRSRVMNTIGVTRGFGDHDLKAINSKIPIKPFLSCNPEVNIIDLSCVKTVNHDEVIIMGTDGLWDVTHNDKAAEIIHRIINQFSDERHKYISAAQALVANARGKPFGESFWRTSEGRMATADDVSCFVIPLAPHLEQHEEFLRKLVLLSDSDVEEVIPQMTQVSIGED